MSIASEPCYECGRGIPDGLGQPARACLGILPDGAQYWAWVEVCPECAQHAARLRHLWTALTFVLVALLTSAIAYPLLP
jgi:hypothetical protein